MVVAEPQIRRVAIVDDNMNDADTMGVLIRDAGFEPVVLRPPFGAVEDLLRSVQEQADAAVCDHRLRGLAQFSGAQAVASLVTERIPAVLVTQYIDTDSDVRIRLWRHRIPIVLSRDDADPERLREGLSDCLREIRGEYPPGRRPWRVLIEIDGLSDEAGEKVVEARVPSWNPHKVVRFPLALIPPEIRDWIVPGECILAMVNIGSERAEDLYFSDFEVAPEPVPEESVG